jgi:hypothetical protein
MDWKDIGGLFAQGSLTTTSAGTGRTGRRRRGWSALHLRALTIFGAGPVAALAGAAERLGGGAVQTAISLWKESSRPGIISTGFFDDAGSSRRGAFGRKSVPAG